MMISWMYPAADSSSVFIRTPAKAFRAASGVWVRYDKDRRRGCHNVAVPCFECGKACIKHMDEK